MNKRESYLILSFPLIEGLLRMVYSTALLLLSSISIVFRLVSM